MHKPIPANQPKFSQQANLQLPHTHHKHNHLSTLIPHHNTKHKSISYNPSPQLGRTGTNLDKQSTTHKFSSRVGDRFMNELTVQTVKNGGNRDSPIDISQRKSFSRAMNSKCQQIITTKVKHLKKRNKNMEQEIVRSKTMQGAYDNLDNFEQTQNILAQQLITQTRNQKRCFRAVLQKFHNLIEVAEYEFVKNQILNINPKKVIECGGLNKYKQQQQVCSPYCDQLSSYERYLNVKTNLYDLNKLDFYTWLKSSNKLINPEQIQQARHFQSIPRYDGNDRKGNQLLYKRYFKSSAARKDYLSTVYTEL